MVFILTQIAVIDKHAFIRDPEQSIAAAVRVQSGLDIAFKILLPQLKMFARFLGENISVQMRSRHKIKLLFRSAHC